MSTSSKKKFNKYIFYAQALKGYSLKILFDILSTKLTRTKFSVDSEGIYNRDMDKLCTIMFNSVLHRNNFLNYKCTEKITFSLALKHLTKLISGVKKKDSLILFIEKNNENCLGIAITPINSENNISRHKREEIIYINIVRTGEQEQELELPDKNLYHYPKIIHSSDIQKIKKHTKICKNIELEIQRDNYLSFYHNEGIYRSKLAFGELEEDEDEDQEKEAGAEDEINLYRAEFQASTFNNLVKLSGLSNQIQFAAPKIVGFPLLIRSAVGNLGDIEIYVKDIIQIQYEHQNRIKNE